MKSKIGLQLPDPDPQDPFRQSWEGAEKVTHEMIDLTYDWVKGDPEKIVAMDFGANDFSAVTVWRPGAVQQISRPPVTVNDKIFWTLDMSAAEPADLTIEELDKAIRSLFILEESAKPPK